MMYIYKHIHGDKNKERMMKVWVTEGIADRKWKAKTWSGDTEGGAPRMITRCMK